MKNGGKNKSVAFIILFSVVTFFYLFFLFILKHTLIILVQHDGLIYY